MDGILRYPAVAREPYQRVAVSAPIGDVPDHVSSEVYLFYVGVIEIVLTFRALT